MNDNPRRLIGHAFFRRYVRVKVPCLHDDENGILLVLVLFFCMLAQYCFFSFGAPHVKRRVKSCRPASVAPTRGGGEMRPCEELK